MAKIKSTKVNKTINDARLTAMLIALDKKYIVYNPGNGDCIYCARAWLEDAIKPANVKGYISISAQAYEYWKSSGILYLSFSAVGHNNKKPKKKDHNTVLKEIIKAAEEHNLIVDLSEIRFGWIKLTNVKE